ncbi:MAG: diguanylate phosphodiesterase, partial [Coprobacillus sp.]
MEWNIAPECISIVILSIVWIYSRKSHMTPSLKNRLFQGCLFVSFVAMATNILSTIMIAYVTIFPLWLNHLITTIYFVFTPLMGLVYSFYSAAIIFEGKETLRRTLLIWMIPGVL